MLVLTSVLGDAVGVEQEDCQKGALDLPRRRERPVTVGDLEWSEYPECRQACSLARVGVSAALAALGILAGIRPRRAVTTREADMPAIHVRLAATLALAILAAHGAGDALARPSANAFPAASARAATTPMLLRASDVPGLVPYAFASRPLSLWESAERENAQRAILRENGWRAGAP